MKKRLEENMLGVHPSPELGVRQGQLFLLRTFERLSFASNYPDELRERVWGVNAEHTSDGLQRPRTPT